MSYIEAAAAGVWTAFASRDADRIRAVLTDDAAWYAPPGNATQVALGLPRDLLETREGIVEFLTRDFRRLFPQGAAFEVVSASFDGNLAIFEQRMTGVTVTGGTMISSMPGSSRWKARGCGGSVSIWIP